MTPETAPTSDTKPSTRTKPGIERTRKPTGIAKGRPPLAAKKQASLSSEKTRQLIRTHHQLNAQLSRVEKAGDEDEAATLKTRIAELGGLESYQLASIQGQASDRGGDSSAILMDWLKPLAPSLQAQKKKLRMLEVGALSTKNACSKSGLLDLERIDLHSQAAGIQQQDFMERTLPAPGNDDERFDLISLSLVLNFVPTAEARGEMLKRTCHFLATRTYPKDLVPVFPALFLVLPAPCTSNSRYMSEERLTGLMASLGYVLLRIKQTAKLVYTLWQLRDKPAAGRKQEREFLKRQVNRGAGRNNFCIVLRDGGVVKEEKEDE